MCPTLHVDGLEQERRNSSALAMELHLSCTNPSMYSFDQFEHPTDVKEWLKMQYIFTIWWIFLKINSLLIFSILSHGCHKIIISAFILFTKDQVGRVTIYRDIWVWVQFSAILGVVALVLLSSEEASPSRARTSTRTLEFVIWDIRNTSLLDQFILKSEIYKNNIFIVRN